MATQTTVTKKPVTSAQPAGVPAAPQPTNFSAPSWQQAYDMSMEAQKQTVQQGTQFAQQADTASKINNTRNTQQEMFANQSNGQGSGTPYNASNFGPNAIQKDHSEANAAASRASADAAQQRAADMAMNSANNASAERVAGTNSYAQQSSEAIRASGSFRVDPQYKFWG